MPPPANRFLRRVIHNAHAAITRGKITSLVLKNGSESRELPDEWLESGANMKCGMDVDGNIALDLRGNVMTCQNTSAVAVSDNGKSHKIGHATDLLGIRMETSMHWTERAHCAGCPVLSMCKGSCMFLDGANWHKSCDAQFSNNVALFALAFEKVTGLVLLTLTKNPWPTAMLPLNGVPEFGPT